MNLDQSRWPWAARIVLVSVCLSLACAPADDFGPGEGPGHRSQPLALTPEQELELGRQAYREILDRATVLPRDDENVRRVREVGQSIAKAATIEPLQREINLHLEGYEFEWEFNVIESDRVNAFCLPGGKVGVFTGLLAVAEEDGHLATVLSHEIAHALAHHASERVAWEHMLTPALRAANNGLTSLAPEQRARLVSLFSPEAGLTSLRYARWQESEADHIGLFLMTFAGYDPEAAVDFWERMSAISAYRPRPPEILSDHPSDARRISQLRAWVPQALGAKADYDAGRIAPRAASTLGSPGSSPFDRCLLAERAWRS
jgi:predicted Zn-dependent protease